MEIRGCSPEGQDVRQIEIGGGRDESKLRADPRGGRWIEVRELRGGRDSEDGETGRPCVRVVRG